MNASHVLLLFGLLATATCFDSLETMVLELKLRKIGKSIGVVLPEEVLSRLNVGAGDAIYLTEGSDGSLRITRSSAEFKNQMEVAEGISRRYARALRDLAK